MPPRTLPPREGERVPIVVWARTLPRQAEAQLRALAAQPYVVGQVAAMADAHLASGVAVGTVFATTRAVVPGALGGDLGCGMSAWPFDCHAPALDRRQLERLLAALARAIPVGDAIHARAPPLPQALAAPPLSTRRLDHMREAVAPRHLGTLGGGNHFLELDRDGGGRLWLLVHSGSRGAGGAVFAHHARAAGSPLAGLSTEEPAGQAYLGDHAFALAFARENRRALCAAAAAVIADEIGALPDGEPIDVHHNFVEAVAAPTEEAPGRTLLVHRKGAIAAPRGRLSLLPGSMATASYLVRGLGAASSLSSAAHGCGRVLSRSQARRAIRPVELERTMRRVVHDQRRLRQLVEEAPAAYRDIAEVLEDQADLVEPVLRLEPIAVLKG